MTSYREAEQPFGNQAMLTDRRASVRYPCELETSCAPLPGRSGLEWSGQVRNISCGGLGISLQRRFEPGTLLAVAIQAGDGSPAQSVLCRVVHVHAQTDGGWLTGCCFASELSEEDVQALLG